MRFLISEDDRPSRIYLNRLLSPYGETVLAADGIEAVEAFVAAKNDNKPFNLICLDIMMPRIDGIQALEAIRDYEKKNGIPKGKSTKVIIISALYEDDVVINSTLKDNVYFLSKPIDTQRLIDIIEDSL